MRNITKMMASFLFFAGMTANAQMAMPTLQEGKLMTAEELNNSKGTKRIAIQLIHQKEADKEDWYFPEGGTNTSHFSKDNADFGEIVVFEWIAKDGKHLLKRVAAGENGYIQQDKPKVLGAEATAQLIRVVQPLPEGGSGETGTNWDDSCPAKDDAHNSYVCRFVKDGTQTWINSNNEGWNTGTGVWTMFYVYDLSGHVEFKEVKGDKVTGLEAGSKISTFSASFETALPEGVQAYTVKQNNRTAVALEEVQGNIPANQGVILVTKNTTNPIMKPATTTVTATVEGLLQGAVDAAVAMGEGDYVLSTLNDVTQFYKAQAGTTLRVNKAYLKLNGAAPAALSLNFGGEATGIENVATADDANAPIYDLSGRRVSSTVKGGIYIQNGKKFIVK